MGAQHRSDAFDRRRGGVEDPMDGQAVEQRVNPLSLDVDVTCRIDQTELSQGGDGVVAQLTDAVVGLPADGGDVGVGSRRGREGGPHCGFGQPLLVEREHLLEQGGDGFGGSPFVDF
jgi:hypothetical protein